MGSVAIGFSDCITSTKNINVTKLVDQTKSYAANGLIDPTQNMFNDAVYVYHGINDSIVLPGKTCCIL